MKNLHVLLIITAALMVASYLFWSESGNSIETNDVEQVQEAHATNDVDSNSGVIEEEHTHDDSHEHDTVTDEDDHDHEVYVAGEHYVVIDKPVDTQTGDKVEVRELFWYYCGHCYNLEPYIHAMEATLTDEALFVRQPSVLGDGWINGAIFYYVLKDLGELDRLHTPLFDAIHKHGIKFNSQEEFVSWLSDNGVDKEKANAVFVSFSVESNVRKAIADTRKYQSRGVPTLVVNGKYWVDAMHAGSVEGIFKVVDYLIEKELH